MGNGIKTNCPHVGLGPVGGLFVRDPSQYLREFPRKLRKTPNDNEDKRHQGLNPAPPVYQF